MITRAQRKSLHTWIALVIVKQHLDQIGRMDGPTEYFLKELATIIFHLKGPLRVPMVGSQVNVYLRLLVYLVIYDYLCILVYWVVYDSG